MTSGDGIMGGSFSSEESPLDKDTHMPKKPREGRVTVVPGLFLRLQTSKAPGIPHFANLAHRMTLIGTLLTCMCSREQPANTEQLALPQHLL